MTVQNNFGGGMKCNAVHIQNSGVYYYYCFYHLRCFYYGYYILSDVSGFRRRIATKRSETGNDAVEKTKPVLFSRKKKKTCWKE